MELSNHADKRKTPILDRDELHKTYYGYVTSNSFNTNMPHWMTNEASFIETSLKFDYACKHSFVARERNNNRLANLQKQNDTNLNLDCCEVLTNGE